MRSWKCLKFVLMVFAITLSLGAQQPKQRTGVSAKAKTPGKAIATPPTTVTPDEAFGVFDELNSSGKLTEAMFGPLARAMGMNRVGGLAKENCFGWRIPSAGRLLGESSGGYYGVTLTDNDKKEYTMVGLLISDAELLLEGKPVKPGKYLVTASPEGLALSTGQDIEKGVSIPLKQPLDPAMFVNQKDGGKSPRYSLELEGSSLSLAIGQNKLRIQSK